MGEWLPDIAALAVAALGMHVLLSALTDGFARWERRLGGAVMRIVRQQARTPGADVVVLRRPIEAIGADVRRLGAAFHHDVMPFAKYEGCRRAYDDALAEAADSLGLEHRIDTLPPGPVRDLERQRIERMLVRAGLIPGHDAA